MQIPGFYLPKRIQVEYHLRRWKMWMILESRLAHKGILSSAWKARQALEILTKFALCANYSILENQPVGFRARMNMRNFPDGPVAKTLLPMQRARGSIPGQGTRCHMPQLKTPRATLRSKTLRASTKTQHSTPQKRNEYKVWEPLSLTTWRRI